ncbi:MAG: DUF4872 domain-containing protein [Deltaproteobacteria bacterium]|nr:MAG: DUF4872 domain-containing protein [Deltaproteobacteria bacterium]
MLVPGYVHRRGIHCGSTSMRNALAFLGGEYREEDLFGLGEGLSFIYVDAQPVPPGVAIHGRSLDLEVVLARRFELQVEVTKTSDPEEALRDAENILQEGRPLIITTDIAHLDYFDSSTHFAGHVVVLVGKNEDGTYLISDSEFPDLQKVSRESLLRARNSDLPPYGIPNLAIALSGKPKNLSPQDWIDAVVSCGERHLFPGDPLKGIPGMLRAAADMPRWGEMTETPEFAARFAYQVIEKRGTGGGFFRRMYARFLAGCARATGRDAFSNLAKEMEKIADLWSDLAGNLKEASQDFSPEKMKICGEKLGEIAVREERFFKEALLLFT